MTRTPPDGPAPGTSTNRPQAPAIIEAATSLAPHKTPHGHRPDWQTARDDQAGSQRDD